MLREVCCEKAGYGSHISSFGPCGFHVMPQHGHVSIDPTIPPPIEVSDQQTAQGIDTDIIVEDVLSGAAGINVAFSDSMPISRAAVEPGMKMVVADVRFTSYSNALVDARLERISGGRLTIVYHYSDTGEGAVLSSYSITTEEPLKIELSDSSDTKDAEITVSGSVEGSAVITVADDIKVSSVRIESFGTKYGTVAIDGTEMDISEASPDAFGTGLGFSGGAGTEDDPVPILDADDLKLLAELVNGTDDNTAQNFAGKHFRLYSDVTISNWEPIGNGKRSSGDTAEGATPFSGVFDGGNNTITVESFAVQEADEGLGIFGYVSGENAVIRNLKVAGNVVYDADAETADNAGFVVGLLDNGATVDFVETVEGSSFRTSGLAGGIVGRLLKTGNITNCVNRADVYAESDKAGGIVAAAYYNDSTIAKYITNCDNYGDVRGVSYTGGIVGLLQGGKVDGCENHGTITSLYAVGGLVGSAEKTTELANLDNYGTIEIEAREFSNTSGAKVNPNSIGGIAGQVVGSAKSTITNAVNHISAAFDFPEYHDSYTYIGGIVGQINALSFSMTGCSNEASIIQVGNIPLMDAGGIAGTVYGAGDTAVSVSGSNSGDIEGTSNLGGIAGSITDAGVASSSNTGTITGERKLGGIAGTIALKADSAVNASIKNSSNSGEIVINESSEYSLVGGIVGLVSPAANSTGTISIKGSDNLEGASFVINDENPTYIGGIVGRFDKGGLIEDVENHAAIEAAGGVDFGGIVGGCYPGNDVVYPSAKYTIRNAENYGRISGSRSLGGIAGYGYSTSFEDCVNHEDAVITGHMSLGGITASLTNGGSITDSENHADIYATCDGSIDATSPWACARYVGGITGYLGYSSDSSHSNAEIKACVVSGCTNSGNMVFSKTGTGMDYVEVGGIVGTYLIYGKVESNTFSGEISGDIRDGSARSIIGGRYTESDESASNYSNVEQVQSFIGNVGPEGMPTGLPAEISG